MKKVIGISLVACAVLCARAETWSVKSPDGKNEIRLKDGDALTVEVLRDGKQRIAPSVIGLTLEGKSTFGIRPKKIGQRDDQFDETIQTPIFKKAAIRNVAKRVTVSFDGGYSVTLHAANDGVAYRFETTLGDGRVKVLDETVGLAFTGPDQNAFVGYAGTGLQSSWESKYIQTKVSAINDSTKSAVYLPLLLTNPDGGATVVTESDLLDYAGLNFVRKATDASKLTASFAKYPVMSKVEVGARQRHVKDREGYIVETTGNRTYPWRVFILADNVAKLVESDLVYALAKPNQIGDTSWIKPGKVEWDWWNDWNLSHVSFRAGVNTETYKYYIDVASKYGIEYVIFDEGWSVKLKIMEINPEVDVPALIEYGKKRNVGIILWAAWSQLKDREEEVIKKYAEMGVAGFKIDFMDRDDADVVNFLTKTAGIAAKYHALVDYHGMYKPTGLSRTYPNIVNYEGVHGLEQLKWEKDVDFPENDCLIVFTRMVAGPLDYTPGAMINQTKSEYRPYGRKPSSQGTRCHQMALMSIFEAPLQMLCDSPSQYLKNKECMDFMSQVPTVWDETIGLAGEPGKYAAIARRKGAVWYVSAIGNWDKREVTLSTDFLNGNYRAEIFADGINADRDATDYTRSFATVKGGEPITIKLMPGGGWTAKLTPKSWYSALQFWK
ncbi:MAG: glycoside hydrolase family 97 protein [Kiritimatiellae bacterium]|nr:glycoside hydrolase family 97 protein [Kiritimatiellia bacterium]